MTEIRIILESNPETADQLPAPEDAARAAAWCSGRRYYGAAAAFMALAHALEVDGYTAAVATAGESLVRVPLIGQTRTENPRTDYSTSNRPYARASCVLCGETIWAYRYEREAVEVTRDPALGGPGYREWMPGRAEFTDWRHSDTDTDRPAKWLPHDATPTGGSVVTGPLPDERGVGVGEH